MAVACCCCCTVRGSAFKLLTHRPRQCLGCVTGDRPHCANCPSDVAAPTCSFCANFPLGMTSTMSPWWCQLPFHNSAAYPADAAALILLPSVLFLFLGYHGSHFLVPATHPLAAAALTLWPWFHLSKEMAAVHFQAVWAWQITHMPSCFPLPPLCPSCQNVSLIPIMGLSCSFAPCASHHVGLHLGCICLCQLLSRVCRVSHPICTAL